MASEEVDLLDQVRRICTTFPEVTERPSHGTPTWFVNGRKSFVQLWPEGHHHDEFPHLSLGGVPTAGA
ncbi:MmcQ/YjbR family DNA-binding protein [Micromonospora sp. NPDC048999]|uniref:MmcQ/YjbR family DNA-binding protein n=1 Tax=Micromonospora sp. NPDC048999 TaxID=3155391 RepID=UPI0033D76640